jgi:hypothetical protein
VIVEHDQFQTWINGDPAEAAMTTSGGEDVLDKRPVSSALAAAGRAMTTRPD